MRGTIFRHDYTYYSNRLSVLLHKAKRLHYYKLFLRNIRNSRKTWLNINSMLGKRSLMQMEYLLVGENIVTKAEMLNYANNYFVSIADNLTRAFQHNTPYAHITAPNPNSCHFLPTDEHEVLNVLNTLKNTSNGVHEVGVACIKNNSHIFAVHITLLYNHSIKKVTFPKLLKVARVVPGYKSGPKNIIDNYRPISNLPVFSKVFEKLTLRRYLSFVDHCSLLSDSQFGFRKGRNITQAAVTLLTHVTNAYHQKSYSACFFLDLRKAFDTLDHGILLDKLYHMGFRGPSHQYLSSFISGRKQFMEKDGIRSNELAINKGVPQGSILGPLLFCLYINDIVAAVNAIAVLFADDAAFYVCAETLPELYKKIHELFSKISSYLNANKLVPNLNKSKLMYFSSRPCEALETLKFDNIDVEWVAEYKYLGLTISNRMCFSFHIERVSTRISQFSGVFYQLNKVLPRHILMMIYFAFILPHLILHIEIWGSAPECHLRKIMVKQNQLLRAILGVAFVNGRPNIGTDDLYRQCNVLSVRNIFKVQLFKFMVLLLRGELPQLYDLLLRPHILPHRYNTRSLLFRHP